MNDLVKINVDSRKNAIFTSYTIDDQKILDKIDDYFKRLEEFAKDYNNVESFEKAFAESSLSKEYIDLFILINNSLPKENNESVVDEVADHLARRAKARAKQEVYNEVRDIPVIGDALTVKQHIDFFGRFKKNK